MAFPTYPAIPDPWPDRAQGQAAFDGAVSATFTFFGALETWSDDFKVAAEGVQAAWLADNVGSLTGQDYRGLMVNGAANALAFSAPLHTLAGHRNKIINGQFNINQRGAASYTADGYTLDRWRLVENGGAGSGAACTITQEDFTLGQTDVPGNPKHFLRFARGTVGTGESGVHQKIEGVETLSGQTATLTFWAKASAATELQLRAEQRFGTGGSPSSTVTTNIALSTDITTAWVKKSFSFTVPSISGKVLGTNGDDVIWVNFVREHDSTSPTASVDIANVSLVAGDATQEEDPGAWRDEVAEQHLCWRYYYTLDGDIMSGGSYASASGQALALLTTALPVEMRSAPTTSSTGVSPTNGSGLLLLATKRRVRAALTSSGVGVCSASGGTLILDAEL